MTEEYVRFLRKSRPVWGRARGAALEVLDAAPWAGPRPTGESLDAASVELLAPAEPGKIVCVGLNYADHAREMGLPPPAEPLLFLKPPSSLLDPARPIRLPRGVGRVEHEAELALVIGRRVGPDRAEGEALFGVTCANDVSARDLQRRDGQWTRAKGFDTFCPLGPALVRGLDLGGLAVECRVNGELRQASNTARMLFTPARIVEFVAGIMTLEPGDVILTGTPAGSGPLAPGDVVEVRIQGIGALVNPVA